MPRIESRALVWLFFAGLGFGVVLGLSQEAVAGAGYRGSWEAKEDEAGRILQLHDHRLSLDLSQDLSERLTSKEKVSYNKRWEQEGVGRESLSPGAGLDLSGELFAASLSVDSVIDQADQRTMADTDALAATWSSRWEKGWVPELRANYDYRRRSADSDTLQGESSTDSLGGEVKWDLQPVELSYSYRRDHNTAETTELTQENHRASIKAGRSWLANRLRVALGYEYRDNSSERLISFAANTVSIALSLSEVRTGTDPDPADVNDEIIPVGPFSYNNAMRDGDTDNSAYTVAAGISNNNSVLLGTSGQQLNTLYLYTRNNLGAAPPGLTWRLYSNDLLTTTWNLEAAPTVTYDTVNRRFVLVLPPTGAAYFKVVVDLDPLAPALDFTEVTVEQVLTGPAGSTLMILEETQADKSNFSLDYQFTKVAALFYNFLSEQSESATQKLTDRESHNGGLRMQNTGGDLKSVLAYSLNRDARGRERETQTETYSLNINKQVLPTLALALSGFRAISSLNGISDSERDSYLFYADARLYPDLNSRLEVQYYQEERFLPGGGSRPGDGLRANFSLTSRFRPSLSVTIAETYEVRNQDEKATLDESITLLNGNWQLSEWLALQGSARRVDSKIGQDVYGYNLGARLGLADGVEMNLAYAWLENVTTSQSGDLKLLVTAKKNLNWEVGCSYAESDTAAVQNVYKFYSRANLHFATR